jgi:hypothetical protein
MAPSDVFSPKAGPNILNGIARTDGRRLGIFSTAESILAADRSRYH